MLNTVPPASNMLVAPKRWARLTVSSRPALRCTSAEYDTTAPPPVKAMMLALAVVFDTTALTAPPYLADAGSPAAFAGPARGDRAAPFTPSRELLGDLG